MKLLSHYYEQQKKQHPQIINWQNHIINNHLSYSFRDTVYTRNTYPSNLHYHDYYELVIFEDGDIRYICDGRVYNPKRGDIIIIPPEKFHMSIINSESTHYKRHVFYLYPTAFNKIGHEALTKFLITIKNGELFTLKNFEYQQTLINTLQHLKDVINNKTSSLEDALTLSYVIQIFYLINQVNYTPNKQISSLPENILMMQNYIDQNFSQISSVAQVAKHLYYSREYTSRLFKKYFDTTISDYIMKRRIAESQKLIIQDIPLIDIAYQVGFGSLSTFIRAFRSVTNMTPSLYRKLRKEQF